MGIIIDQLRNDLEVAGDEVVRMMNVNQELREQLTDKERRITTLKHDRKMLLDTLNSLCNKVEEMKLQGGN